MVHNPLCHRCRTVATTVYSDYIYRYYRFVKKLFFVYLGLFSILITAAQYFLRFLHHFCGNYAAFYVAAKPVSDVQYNLSARVHWWKWCICLDNERGCLDGTKSPRPRGLVLVSVSASTPGFDLTWSPFKGVMMIACLVCLAAPQRPSPHTVFCTLCYCADNPNNPKYMVYLYFVVCGSCFWP